MINENSIYYQVEGVETNKFKTMTGEVLDKIKADVTVIDDSLEATDGSSFRYPFKVLIEKNNNKFEYRPNREEIFDFLNSYNPTTEEEYNHDLDILFRIFNDPLMHEDCQRIMAKQTYQIIPLTFKQEDLFSDDYVARYNVKYRTGAGEWTVSEVSVNCRLGRSDIEISDFKTKDTLLKDIKKDIEKDIKNDLYDYLWQQRDRDR